MGALTLRLSFGAAALLFASGAPAQVDPQLRFAAQAPGQPSKAMFNATSVTVQDRDGDALSIVYGQGPVGTRRIEFRDADGSLINTIHIGSPAPPPSAGTGQNPLKGNPLPNLAQAMMGGGDGKADSVADMRYLREQVANLNKQVRLLTDRINAAAAK